MTKRGIVAVLTLALVFLGAAPRSVAAADPATTGPSDEVLAARSAAIDEFRAAGASYLRWSSAGRITADTTSMSAEAATLATEAARTLSEAKAAGYIQVTSDFKVSITESGRTWISDQLAATSGGCITASSIKADHTGFHVELEAVCTEAQLRERVGVVQPAGQVPDPNTTAGPPPAAARGVQGGASTAAGRGPLVISEQMGCALSAVGLGIAAVGLLLLWFFPPAGWLLWVSIALRGGGAILAWLGFVLNCTGIFAVKERDRVGRVPRGGPSTQGAGAVVAAPRFTEHYCSFGYYGNYRWSWVAFRYVPTYARWNC
jgi:hypothetical protein